MLVVVLIIGIMAAGIALSLGVTGKDQNLATERDRLLGIMGHLREQAGMQNREYGMRAFDGGYEFLVYAVRRGRWESLEGDSLTRRRKLPPAMQMSLTIEGRSVVLPKADQEDPAPQILLYSSGELSSFELTLQREGAPQAEAEIIRSDPAGEIVTGPAVPS